MDKINAIASSSSEQKIKTDEYRTLLNEFISNKNVENLNAFVDHMVNESTPLVISRIVLKEFSTKIDELPKDEFIAVATHAISAIQPRVVSFEEQISELRQKLSHVYEQDGEWIEAAKLLIGIPLESGQRILSKEVKVNIYVKIAQLYLEEEEFYEAERYLNKASSMILESQDEDNIIRYKASLARVYEFKRKFFEAAVRYYELSKVLLNKEDRDHALESAIVCAILAPAGPQRSRILATLYKDERSSSIVTFPMLQKMFMDRIISKKEVDSFVAYLEENEKKLSKNEDGTTVLDQAIIEHNLLSASKVYMNIKFDQLGFLLNISDEEAERLAALMIGENRLEGYIDQVHKIIHFQNSNPLKQWDHYIEVACSTVNRIVDEIAITNPEFLKNELSTNK